MGWDEMKLMSLRYLKLGVALLLILASVALLQERYGHTAVKDSEDPKTIPVVLPVAHPSEKETAVKVEDPFLLLVNPEQAIPENYSFVPAFIEDEAVDIRIYDALTRMIEDAGKDNCVLWIASAYRDKDYQTTLLNKEIEKNQKKGLSPTEAEKLALQTMTKPGYSEHHTGLAIDLNTVSEEFGKTAEYAWLKSNAWKYGFVQRYEAEKEDITGIAEECWHFRYVGTEHAERMQVQRLCLEEYLDQLREQPTR